MNKRQKKKFNKKHEYKKYGIVTKIYSVVNSDDTLDIVSVEFNNGSGKVCKAERYIDCHPVSMGSANNIDNQEQIINIEFKGQKFEDVVASRIHELSNNFGKLLRGFDSVDDVPSTNFDVEEAWSSLLSVFTSDKEPEPMYGNNTEDDMVIPLCSVCIYRSDCPCGYSRGNAACLTIFKSINS